MSSDQRRQLQAAVDALETVDPELEPVTERIQRTFSAQNLPPDWTPELFAALVQMVRAADARLRAGQTLEDAVSAAMSGEVRYDQTITADTVQNAKQVFNFWLGDATAGLASRSGPVLATTTKSAAVVNSLPRSVPDFTGREEELNRLSRIPDEAAGVVAIYAVHGMAGVGKTELAVRAAHLLADRYPDAQLFLDLHGFTPDRAPVTPASALESLLRAIGVPTDQLPADVDQRAALWRAQVADRRVLLVLDNAADEAQVAPLLPGAARCLVLITSRHNMVALDGAGLVPVDVPSEQAATALFSRITHLRGMNEADMSKLVTVCGRLPLAIRLAAGRLLRRPQMSVAGLAAELADAQSRLDLLRSGDRDVRAAFGLSYAALDPGLRLLFRRLGLHPGSEITVAAAAALSAISTDAAVKGLEELLGQSLVQEPLAARFTLHDLLRQYARECSMNDDSDEERLEAERRLLALYLSLAQAATASLNDSESSEAAKRQAREWLELERGNLAACAQMASGREDPRAIDLAVTSADHLLRFGHLDDAEVMYKCALAVARAVGDQPGRATAHLGLADIERFTGRYGEAQADYRTGRQIYADAGDAIGQGKALYGLGELTRVTGDYQAARLHFQTAIDWSAARGARRTEADALRGLGEVEQATGTVEAAREHFRRSVELSIAERYRFGQLYALTGLGEAERVLGEYKAAREHYQAAYAMAVDDGDRRGQMNALYGLGEIARLSGDYRSANDYYTSVNTGTAELGNRRGQAYSLIGLGMVDLALGGLRQAAERFRGAVEICSELDDRRGRAAALAGLGDASQEDHDSALAAWQSAMADYAALGLTDRARDIGDRIARLKERG